MGMMNTFLSFLVASGNQTWLAGKFHELHQKNGDIFHDLM